jgi:hypothetical protein
LVGKLGWWTRGGYMTKFIRLWMDGMDSMSNSSDFQNNSAT